MRHGPGGIGLPEGYEPPDWYNYLRAADRLHVPVVEAKSIKEVPHYWIQRALLADRVEQAAQEARQADQMQGMMG